MTSVEAMPTTNTDLASTLANFSTVNILYVILGMTWLIGFTWQISRLISYLKAHRQKRATASIIKKDGYELAELPYPISIHTFLRTIFFPAAACPVSVILTHEIAHARQGHSYDRVIIRILRSFCWFLPHLRWFENALILVHETLADQAVIRSGIHLSDYQNILLDALSRPTNNYAPASGFNFSITKKRFLMLRNTSTNRPRLLFKLLVSAVVFFSLSLLIRETIYAQSPTSEISKEIATDVYTEIISKQLSEADLERWMQDDTYTVWLDDELLSKEKLTTLDIETVSFYMVNKLPADAAKRAGHDFQIDMHSKTVVAQQQHERGLTIQNAYYAELAQRKDPEAEAIKAALRVEPKHPTAEQLTNWLDEKIYAVWIDGKRAQSAELLTLTTDDVYYYSVSKLARNAVNFGKYTYQVNLMKKEAFLKFQASVPATPPGN